MKIAYFSYLADIKGKAAGSANKAIGFVEALNQLGEEAKIFWRSKQPAEPLMSRPDLKSKLKNFLKKYFARYLHEPKILLSNIQHLREENKIIREYNPDIIFTRLSLYSFSSLLLAKYYGKGYVVEADCPPIYENNTFYGKDYFHLSRLAEFVERQNLLKADAIIVLSNILRDYFLEKGVPGQKMIVIPNGADPERFRPQPKDKKLQAKLGINQQPVIGWIGSLAGGWAGLQSLINMAREVMSQREEVVFLFVGGGRNRELFKESFQGSQKKRVILPGTVPYNEIHHYVTLMDIVIAPYPRLPFWYASSMKVFEYMAAGKAVIASAVGQITEIIQHGENGLLFDPDQEGDLTAQVLTLIDNIELRQQLGKSARETVLQKYTWQRHARKMIDVFAKINSRRTSQIKNEIPVSEQIG